DFLIFFFFQAEDGIRDSSVTGVQTCALPIYGTIDVTGPIGDGGLAYRFIGYGVSEDYWRNFGRHREMLVAPSLAWYGDMTTVQQIGRASCRERGEKWGDGG